MWRDGTLLVIRPGTAFPPRCVKSNEPAHVFLQQELEYRPLLFVFMHLFSHHLFLGIFSAIVSQSVTKKVTISVGLSKRWFSIRRQAIIAAGIMVVGSFIVMGWSIPQLGDNRMCVYTFLFGFLGVFAGLLYGLNASHVVVANRITDDFVWIKGVHRRFLAELPPWPGEEEVNVFSTSRTKFLH